MEVIDQFKRLSENEQGKVVEFIRKDSSSKVRYADDEAAKAAAEAVFDEHPELFRKLAQWAIRLHWGIESMHWILDMTFREDESRTRIGHAAKTLSMARKFALNLLRKTPGKESIKGKQQIAGWNQEYLLKILQV